MHVVGVGKGVQTQFLQGHTVSTKQSHTFSEGTRASMG